MAPGCLTVFPRAFSSHQHSAPPRYVTTIVSGFLRSLAYNRLRGLASLAAALVAFGGTAILIVFHSQVVDGARSFDS